MVDRGLREVANPSELFLGNRDEVVPGTAIVVACEGTRPIVVELQALVSPTSYSCWVTKYCTKNVASPARLD